jgi:hypothetical protein
VLPEKPKNKAAILAYAVDYIEKLQKGLGEFNLDASIASINTIANLTRERDYWQNRANAFSRSERGSLPGLDPWVQ